MAPADVQNKHTPTTMTEQAQADPKGRSTGRGPAHLAGRLVSSALLIGGSGAIIFWAPVWVFAGVATFFGLVALFEFFTMARNRGILVHRPMSMLIGALFFVLVSWRSLADVSGMAGAIPRDGAAVLSWSWDVFWPMAIIIIFLRQLTRRNTFEALGGLSTTLFGLAYICGLWSYLFYLRAFKDHQGAWLVAFLVLVTKMGDVGAFSIGRSLGRHTLVARISPRKTKEGFVGGLIASAATGALASSIVPAFQGMPVKGFAVGLLLGMFGQLGDLAESLIKRDCQVKDSAQWMPGLGGVLDVIDSLLFTAPLFYAVLIYG